MEVSMDDVVDRVMDTFGMMRNLDVNSIVESREKLSGYIEKLNSAGQTDRLQLAVYGLAYLRELQDGPAPQFTGC
jgi:hypothetical protein